MLSQHTDALRPLQHMDFGDRLPVVDCGEHRIAVAVVAVDAAVVVEAVGSNAARPGSRC